MSTIEEQVRNGAVRLRQTAIERVRAVALNKEAAIDHWMDQKAAVDPHTGPLSGLNGYYQIIHEVERRSVLGQVGAARVPFATGAVVLTSAPTSYWVGHGDPKPVSVAGLATVNLDPTKVATLCVFSQEQLRHTGDGADEDLERALASSVAAGVNAAFLSDSAGVADEQPAGILNGVTPVASTGLADNQIFTDLIGALDGMSRPTIIAALPIALRIWSAFGAGADGLKVVVTPEAGDLAVIVDENAVAYATGALDVDTSGQTSLAMADNPQSPANHVSMFQTNSVAIRAELFANWEVVRADGVAAIDFGSD
jgi:hypothetical protein